MADLEACRCGRPLRLLNVTETYGPASDQPKCPGCGYPAALCPCAREVKPAPEPEAPPAITRRAPTRRARRETKR